MTFQYSLRFESGERRGEVVPLTIVAAQGGTFTIGRKPGNSLQVTDASISGRHAELSVDEYGVSLRDLNSTNGTQVAGRKVRQTSLDPGDEFTLGAVEFTLMEGSPGSGGGAAAAAVPASSGEDLDELVLEEPADVAPAASMPRRAPSKAPAKAPAKAPTRAPAKAAPAAAHRPAPPVKTEGLGETQLVPQEDGLEITAEDLARSAKSSKLGPILLVGLAAVGGAAWWWLGQKADDDGGDDGARSASVQAPSSPSGNLLSAGYSFEDSDGWVTDPEAATEFSPARSARRSGVRGIQADLVGGESSSIESEPIRVPSGQRSFRALGYVRADSGVELRLGLRYSTGTGEGSIGTTVWSDPASASDEFLELGIVGSAPQGMSHVQVIVRAECTDAAPEVSREDGDSEDDESLGEVKSVSVDDVALVPASDAPAAIQLDPVTVTALGAASTSAVKAAALTSLDRILVSSIRVAKPSASGGATLGSQDLGLAPVNGGFSLTPAGGGTLVVRAESIVMGGGIATISAGGYASHGSTFEREGVTGLILGDGAEMVHVAFSSPATVTARASGDGTTFRAQITGGQPVTVKTSFMEERTLAQRLARRAKEERTAGDSGSALATWDELLTTVPFDGSLIEQAAIAQSELLGEGRSELKELTGEVERARFFGLADLYREKLARAEDLSQRYRGTDVESQATALADAIQLELEALDSGDARDELIRLEAIGSVLKRSGADDLAKRLDAYRAAEAEGSDKTMLDTRASDEPGNSAPNSSGGQ